MVCYMDQWFCNKDSCDKWKSCDRALTEEVQHKADKWWGREGAPIAIRTECVCYVNTN